MAAVGPIPGASAVADVGVPKNMRRFKCRENNGLKFLERI
jgi:hypothetical protein